jgi:putative chitinase
VTLRPGDNLTRIAAQYGTSVDAILAANGLANANRIYAGASLVIPTADMPIAPAETAAPAETTETAEAATPQADITPQAQAPQADTNPQTEGPANTYTVAPGDSAFKIARRFGVDQQALLDANNISNPNRVYAGQVLTIPS